MFFATDENEVCTSKSAINTLYSDQFLEFLVNDERDVKFFRNHQAAPSNGVC